MSQLYDQQLLKEAAGWKQDAYRLFAEKLSSTADPFPCIPAVKGFKSGQLRYAFGGDPRREEGSQSLAKALKAFGEKAKDFGSYTSLIFFFQTPAEVQGSYSVKEYEELFWFILSETGKYDEMEWPGHIPENPMDSAWEYCFCGEQYFVYCGTPAHTSRKSRSFPYLMLAITPRWVLDVFNAKPAFASRVKENIRNRLENYDAVPAHPDLNQYGNDDNFEWKQYFLNDDQSASAACPFHRLHRLKK
ncbi:YqcI/YcgG family protein [Metabacillus sp. GX 13764]|uniref:YqcI/YcgG family protein n=1 Tax=Metabacillus kandeliae TaxID=2900151 RepID=UPI001E394B09|nr:YqcI/YcgG family protein [Metabacillus kandeliae]MCD7036075.1 YqcI/YcgG family protein [Metabacillus kandeliae]